MKGDWCGEAPGEPPIETKRMAVAQVALSSYEFQLAEAWSIAVCGSARLQALLDAWLKTWRAFDQTPGCSGASPPYGVVKLPRVFLADFHFL